MKIEQFVTDDDAVSPVIGVILMVAITVILAAVIATFVLGLGDQVNSTANAGVSIDQSSGTATITITSMGSNADTVQYSKNGGGFSGNNVGTSTGASVDVSVSTGDRIVVRVTGTGDTQASVIQTYTAE